MHKANREDIYFLIPNPFNVILMPYPYVPGE